MKVTFNQRHPGETLLGTPEVGAGSVTKRNREGHCRVVGEGGLLQPAM
jgi:hypothetical protein